MRDPPCQAVAPPPSHYHRHSYRTTAILTFFFFFLHKRTCLPINTEAAELQKSTTISVLFIIRKTLISPISEWRQYSPYSNTARRFFKIRETIFSPAYPGTSFVSSLSIQRPLSSPYLQPRNWFLHPAYGREILSSCT